MYELLDSMQLDTFEKHMRADDIRTGEIVGVAERQINMCLGGKMHDCVDIVLSQAVHHVLVFGDVTFVEGEV